MTVVTLELLKQICPGTKVSVLQKYVEPLNVVGEHYGLFENPKRIAAFIAQIAHESGGFNFTEEGLKFSSAARLMAVHKKYFPTVESTKGYVGNAEKTGNKVYANRMSNGPESSGDGYLYRGRGLIQLTGKDNYTKFSKAINRFMDETIAYLETPEGAVVSAGWFWDINKLNIYADKEDFVNLTRRINGGTNGLQDRLHHYELAKKALS